jgi:hypothetical protein
MASYNSRTGFIVGKLIIDKPKLDTLYFLSKLSFRFPNDTYDTTFTSRGVEYMAVNLRDQIQQIGLPKTSCDAFPRFSTNFFIVQMHQTTGQYSEHLNRQYSFWIQNFSKISSIGQVPGK